MLSLPVFMMLHYDNSTSLFINIIVDTITLLWLPEFKYHYHETETCMNIRGRNLRLT